MLFMLLFISSFFFRDTTFALFFTSSFFFFFQAEDGIRDAQESRGLGDVYKRQPLTSLAYGMARKASTPPRDVPRTRPRFVCTRSELPPSPGTASTISSHNPTMTVVTPVLCVDTLSLIHI
eukprot:TRINITY_DN66056_c0_g1_i1.p1 TRINITY_DN66056_c0_g1~~TRINITY_DN66056_c0_g1_i1.p1  ORF type:complete len:121 (-),score=25.38 TRINITY_DN66056_c0_g1_i1:45-407(-)